MTWGTQEKVKGTERLGATTGRLPTSLSWLSTQPGPVLDQGKDTESSQSPGPCPDLDAASPHFPHTQRNLDQGPDRRAEVH